MPGMHLVEGKVKSAEEAVKLVRPGNHVFLGTACATPRTLVRALEDMRPPPADTEFVSFITTGALSEPLSEGRARTIRHRVFFVGTDVAHLHADGLLDYVPISLSEVPALIDAGRLKIDVAFVQVSPPDERGYVSLGTSVDITLHAVRTARKVIAEINPHMPRTFGQSFIHVDCLDAVVLIDEPLLGYSHPPAAPISTQVARYIAGVIEDGSTLQIGLGRIPNEALRHLTDRRDLGVHSDVITDDIIPLIEAGAITGRRKNINVGTIVASWCLGTKKLFDLIHENPAFSFLPMDLVSDPEIVEQHDKMVSLTQAFAVDLTGQVCVDQFEGKFYGGVSTQPDFMRGAARSRGGKPIICLASTTDDGKTSRIRVHLEAGEGVGIPRSDVHYVITEYGIAYLFGRSIRERALALIEVAHPDFRAGLLAEAKERGYVHKEQFLVSSASYRIADERRVKLKNGQDVLLRPARASDAAALQDLFQRMSEEDVYTRFFRRMKQLTYKEAQNLCNVNNETDVAFVAVTGARESETIIGSSCYFLNPTSNLAEVGYMIEQQWQGSGLGGALQGVMADFAKARGVKGFVAEILPRNIKMLKLAASACERVTTENDGDCVHVTMWF
ncbi:MAG: GNAT family N-acetyltransferase [Beijerinckiaceae bacterium]|nr:GNAT family N-acetyltransferase [Beijerinckiaceae bacterium]